MRRWARRVHHADMDTMERLFRGTVGYSAFWPLWDVRQAMRRVAPLCRGRVLDVGCGKQPYRDLLLAQSSVRSYEGVDRQPGPGVRYGLAEALPCAEGVIHTLVCTEVLEHLPDPGAALREFRRVLAPSGVLIVTTPTCFPLHDRADFARYTEAGLQALVEAHGFRVFRHAALGRASSTLTTLVGMTLEHWLYWTPLGYLCSFPLRPLLWLTLLLLNLLGGLGRWLPQAGLASHALVVAVPVR